MFAGKVRAYQSEAPGTNTLSLLRIFVNYGGKKFNNIGTCFSSSSSSSSLTIMLGSGSNVVKLSFLRRDEISWSVCHWQVVFLNGLTFTNRARVEQLEVPFLFGLARKFLDQPEKTCGQTL
jgi:hypothetical protein